MRVNVAGARRDLRAEGIAHDRADRPVHVRDEAEPWLADQGIERTARVAGFGTGNAQVNPAIDRLTRCLEIVSERPRKVTDRHIVEVVEATPEDLPPALAAALQTLLADAPVRQHMGLLGEDRLEECFNAERMTGETLALYEDLLVRRGRATQ